MMNALGQSSRTEPLLADVKQGCERSGRVGQCTGQSYTALRWMCAVPRPTDDRGLTFERGHDGIVHELCELCPHICILTGAAAGHRTPTALMAYMASWGGIRACILESHQRVEAPGVAPSIARPRPERGCRRRDRINTTVLMSGRTDGALPVGGRPRLGQSPAL
ncbi:hypothetical protein BC628DRAFT_226282 [Trametes gibbosa]|nr:hypothetical protein BC628DRAFT_226282 [Trametes gibbosa]